MSWTKRTQLNWQKNLGCFFEVRGGMSDTEGRTPPAGGRFEGRAGIYPTVKKDSLLKGESTRGFFSGLSQSVKFFLWGMTV